MRLRRALLSLSDKSGLVPFATGLASLGADLLSTGGTARALRDAGLAVTDVAAVTGFPEMLDGRVKTLHPRIHGALLALRDRAEHTAQLAAHGIEPIDLVAVSLYPFEATLAGDPTLSEAIEQIDIGGPALLRSAAKNFMGVAPVVDPADYPAILDELHRVGDLGPATRRRLAAKAFAHTARYDSLIAAFFERLCATDTDDLNVHFASLPRAAFPPLLQLRLEKVQELRYGENPHQAAAWYRDVGGGGLARSRQLQGKELSYNNLLDLHSAWALVREFATPVAVIIKHNNPCGVATDHALATAYLRARDADPVSAFGGILGFNRTLDAETARAIAATFVEAVIAPAYAPDALQVLADKKNLRVLELPLSSDDSGEADMRRVSGGLLVQDRDRADLDPATLQVPTQRRPSDAEMADLAFAWKVAKHVKSNAIVLAREGATVGVGAGQMSRVDSVRLAIAKAATDPRGSVLASDAFFPFRDGVESAAEAGVTAVIQPGGSVRDAEVIAAADTHGIAMVLTGIRHFRH